MSAIAKILQQMRDNPEGVRYSDLLKVCVSFFGVPRQSGGSHTVFKMPWQGDPRINIQNDKGKAKSYQVKNSDLAVGASPPPVRGAFGSI